MLTFKPPCLSSGGQQVSCRNTAQSAPSLAPDCLPAPQFALWYLTLVLSRRGILGVWSPSLAMPSPAAQFWLAVCVGACQVRRAAAAPGQALRTL